MKASALNLIIVKVDTFINLKSGIGKIQIAIYITNLLDLVKYSSSKILLFYLKINEISYQVVIIICRIDRR